MSAFLCSNETFSSLAGYACTHGLTIFPVEKLAELFYLMNMKSLIVRYGNKAANDGDFAFLPGHSRPASFDPIQIIKAAQCLQYQSCEFNGWEQTSVCELLHEIIALALKQAGHTSIDTVRRTLAYQNAAWH